MEQTVQIGNKTIGTGHPCFVVAELSGNHGGSFDKALAIIDAALDAGADAIKLQTYTPDTLTIDCDNEWFKVRVNEAWSGRTLYQLYQEAMTPWEWHKPLKDYVEQKGGILFSTPFDETAVDFLESLNVDVYKVASFEAADIRLLRKIGSTKKPVIVSRGLQSVDDVEMAIDILKKNGAPAVAILHCISSYPATIEQMNIATVADIRQRFKVISGLSDHSSGTIAAVAAVAQGASIIEKHVTLSRAEGGVDAAFSLEPQELKELVKTIREVETAIGKPTYAVSAKEKENLVFKRSIFVVKNVKKGDRFTENNVRIIRPGYGMAPKEIDTVLGKKALTDIPRGTPLTKELVSND